MLKEILEFSSLRGEAKQSLGILEFSSLRGEAKQSHQIAVIAREQSDRSNLAEVFI